MRDKMAIASLAVSGITFLLVLLSPVPEGPSESTGRPSEGIANRGQAEANALDTDLAELDQLKARSATLLTKEEGEGPDGGDTDKLVQSLIDKEVARRWRDFEGRLKVLQLYEKAKAEKAKAEKAKAEKAKAEKAKAEKAKAAKAAAKPVKKPAAKPAPAKDKGK